MESTDAAPLASPIFGERALHLPREGALVVGDLHVGLESSLREAGVNIPSQTQRMRERLAKLLEATGATRIIVIGDLKHKVPYTTRQEAFELPTFFRGLPADVELVPGNHDVDFEDHLDIPVHPATGLVLGDVGLLHGHTWPSPDVMAARIVVTCHNHPAVLLVDALGHRHKEAAWIRARFTPAAKEKYAALRDDAQLIVMPAFNELTGGTAFNAPEGERLLGPLFGNAMVDVDDARVWTVDGVDLGTIAGLRRFGAEKGKAQTTRQAAKRKPGWIE